MMALLWTLTCLGLLSLCEARSGKKSGQYNVTLTGMGNCEDGGTNEIMYHTVISKSSRDTLCYSGWINLLNGYNDDMQEVWEISSLGSTGGWKSNFLSFKNKHACSDTKRMYPQWFKNFAMAKLNDTSCPIPKGNYSFPCLDLTDIQFLNVKNMLYGTYRVTVHNYRNTVKIGCTIYQGIVYPRVNSTVVEGTS